MYRNLKLAKKLLLGFGVIAVAAAAMLGIALYFLVNVGNTEHQLYIGPFVSTSESMGVRRDINFLGKEIRSAALEKDISKYQQELDSTVTSVNDRLAKIEASFQGDKSYISNLKSAFDELVVQKGKVTDLMNKGQWDSATSLIFRTI